MSRLNFRLLDALILRLLADCRVFLRPTQLSLQDLPVLRNAIIEELLLCLARLSKFLILRLQMLILFLPLLFLFMMFALHCFDLFLQLLVGILLPPLAESRLLLGDTILE